MPPKRDGWNLWKGLRRWRTETGPDGRGTPIPQIHEPTPTVQAARAIGSLISLTKSKIRIVRTPLEAPGAASIADT